jgi:hypothetical protein
MIPVIYINAGTQLTSSVRLPGVHVITGVSAHLLCCDQELVAAAGGMVTVLFGDAARPASLREWLAFPIRPYVNWAPPPPVYLPSGEYDEDAPSNHARDPNIMWCDRLPLKVQDADVVVRGSAQRLIPGTAPDGLAVYQFTLHAYRVA